MAQERGMKPSIVILPVLLALSSFSYGQEKAIYKCADSEGIGYRDTPCPRQQEQTLVTSARGGNWQTASRGSGTPRARSHLRAPPLPWSAARRPSDRSALAGSTWIRHPTGCLAAA